MIVVVAFMFGLAAFCLGCWSRQDRLHRLSSDQKRLRINRRHSATRWIGRRLPRQAKSGQGWAEFLEGLAVASLSGVDLLTAFQSAKERAKGPLAADLSKILVSVRGGMPMSQALMAAADSDPRFSRLAQAVQRSEVLGTPISSVLMSLSEECRAKERSQMLARFNSLPLKLSLITVVLLLPPVIVVTIVPHVLRFLDSGW